MPIIQNKRNQIDISHIYNHEAIEKTFLTSQKLEKRKSKPQWDTTHTHRVYIIRIFENTNVLKDVEKHMHCW